MNAMALGGFKIFNEVLFLLECLVKPSCLSNGSVMRYQSSLDIGPNGLTARKFATAASIDGNAGDRSPRHTEVLQARDVRIGER